MYTSLAQAQLTSERGLFPLDYKACQKVTVAHGEHISIPPVDQMVLHFPGVKLV